MSKKLDALIAESWSVGWPMTLIMFFSFLIGITDVYVAGKFGKEVQASYGLAFQMYFIFSIVSAALTVGSVSVVSRLSSAKNDSAFKKAVGSSLAIAAVSGLALSIVSWVLSPGIMYMLNIPAILRSNCVQLFQVYAYGLLFNYMLINTNGIMRSCGLIRYSLLSMSVACVLNIALNFLLAFFTPLGYKGIAAATCISTSVGSILNIYFLIRRIGIKLGFSREAAKKMLAIGWPAGALQILWQLATMVLFLILGLMPRHNIEIMAAFTNGLKIESAVFLPAFAFSMSCAVIVGNLLGEGRREEAVRAGIVSACLGACLVALLSLMILFNASIIAPFLSDNIIVIRQSLTYIYISLIAEPLMAWGVILAGALNGAGDTKGVMFIVALSVWCVRLPLSYVLGIVVGLGPVSVWWSMNLSILCQTVFITRRYLRKQWIYA